MAEIKDLRPYNTFGVPAECEVFIPVFSELDVYKALVYHKPPYKILGGGSNVLITKDIDEVILHNCIKGIQVVDEDESSAMVAVGAGENWHQFVMWCLSHNLGGLENLSLIPGKVGAAPIQNIGAYGVEQVDCFHSLKAVSFEEGTSRRFFKEDCNFGYRDSIFKKELKGKYIITEVTYLLSKNHTIHTEYGAIQEKLSEMNVSEPTIQDVSAAIVDIRQSKLPDPAVIPNGGSFFKNPIITKAKLESLKQQYPDVKFYPVDDAHVKVPAAWLIDKAGFKGVERGKAGVHKDHALVLINRGGATGVDINNLADEIASKIKSTYDISLEKEVNIW